MSTQVLAESHTPTGAKRDLFGLMVEFDSAPELMRACENARDAGYQKMDAYTPLPIHGLSEALGIEDNSVQRVVFTGAMVGMVTGFSLMYYITIIAYPMNIGGKPHFSWPAYIPPTFETTILFAALSAVFGMIALNGFPMPYHPVWNNPRFDMASTDRFFLCIEATDPKFDLAGTRKFLEAQHGREVVEVDN